MVGHYNFGTDLKDTSPHSDADFSFDQITHQGQNSEMISGINRELRQKEKHSHKTSFE